MKPEGIVPRWVGYSVAIYGGLLIADILMIVAFGERGKTLGQPYAGLACTVIGVLAQIAHDLQSIAYAMTESGTGASEEHSRAGVL